ncbi:hypothetical protein TNCV_4475321 [Trichonephila clavipes]|nr:hypothetical protein TNCV_4475321 [Trichonephila clavipes]
MVAAVAEWYRYRTVACFVTVGSSCCLVYGRASKIVNNRTVSREGDSEIAPGLFSSTKVIRQNRECYLHRCLVCSYVTPKLVEEIEPMFK